jgi:hypothetical protein
MKDFEIHTNAMFQLVKDYAQNHDLCNDLSVLLLIREIQDPEHLEMSPLRMAIQGENSPMAIKTIHYAAQILTTELRDIAQQTLGQISNA